METYLVGGAVRDRLLGRRVNERDWVVVGATPDEMRERGFRSVGRDFPVFLHPDTNEEYALARTERKTGRGYHGFEFHAEPDVTLEQDLARRDLTVNAMAEDESGRVIDPFDGRTDLEKRTLRHVSDAFVEDPVRILRVGRFAARFASLGFGVAEETLTLMRRMVDNGEVDHLVAERVWQETRRALDEETPSVFFRVLRDCGALARIFPEIDALFGVPQPEKHHPEIDTGVHTLMVVDMAARLSDDNSVRFAALVHDLGKGVTPEESLPGHKGHEEAGVPLIRRLCERLRTPKDCRELAEVVSRYHLLCHKARELRPGTVLKVLEGVDAFRKPDRFERFLVTCEADARGRKGFEEREYPQPAVLRRAYEVASKIGGKDVDTEGLAGPEIKEAIRNARVRAIAEGPGARGPGPG